MNKSWKAEWYMEILTPFFRINFDKQNAFMFPNVCPLLFTNIAVQWEIDFFLLKSSNLYQWHTWWKCHWYSHVRKSSVGIYRRERETYVYTQTCIQLCIAALFETTQTENIPNRHQLVNGETNSDSSMHTMEYKFNT